MKFFGNIDLQGNRISNVAIENKTTSNVNSDSINEGRVLYDSDRKKLVLHTDSEKKPIPTGNHLSEINIVTKSSGNLTVSSSDINGNITFEEGDNMQFEVDELNRTIKLNSNVDYTANNFATIFGDSSNTTYNIEHNLGTPNVVLSVLINQGANAHPNVTVERYTVINDDTIEVELNTAPGADTLSAVVNSKHGDKGPQGPTGPQGSVGSDGAQGPQGPVMSDILQYANANVGDILTIDANGNVYATDITFNDISANTKSRTYNTKNTQVAVLFDHIYNYTNNTATVIKAKSNVSANTHRGNVKLIELETKDGGNSSIEIFNIDGYGKIFSDTFRDSSNGLVQYESDGSLSKSNIDPDDGILLKNKKITISSSQIKTSYTSPVTLIEAPGSGKYIVPIKILMKYNFNTVEYEWEHSAIIQSETSSNRMFECSPQILNGSRTAFQQGDVSFSEEVGFRFLKENKKLIFKTLNANPTSGDGTIEFHIIYHIIDF